MTFLLKAPNFPLEKTIVPAVLQHLNMVEKAPQQNEITQMLRDWSDKQGGDSADALLRVVYDELRRLARGYLQKERIGHTLQTTALVHEAYVKLINQESVTWESRSHFYGIAATMMRRILIDYARIRHGQKRGGAEENLPIENALTIAVGEIDVDLLALDEVLDRLTLKDRQMAKIVELRFFSGLDVPETAEVLGVSESTVKREWAIAKAWLHHELSR